MKNTKKQNDTQGFTIVELLIVIVVVGILAAIIVVTYNGVQARATATALESSVETYKKGLVLYATANKSYPVTNASFCLGEVSNYPNGCYSSGQASQSVSDGLRTVMSTLPQVDSACRYMYSDCRRNLTLFYQPTATLDGAPHAYYLAYFTEKNQNCTTSGNVGGTWENYSSTPNVLGYFERDSTTQISMCLIAMPDPAAL